MAISDIKTESYDSMVSFCNLKIKGDIWETRHSLKDLPDFKWLFELREDHLENCKLYMPYLCDELTWPEGHDALVDCNTSNYRYKTLLSTKRFDGIHLAAGNIDVVVAEKADAENHAIRQNIKAGIALKKADNPGEHEHQVVLQHFAASSLNPNFGILTMMADLKTRWHFYWFAAAGKRLYKLKTTRQEAASTLLKQMFEDPGTAAVCSSLFSSRVPQSWHMASIS